ncbi:MAG: class I SAM-dependent methyltransferase [Aquisalimonadaceae bacterium]
MSDARRPEAFQARLLESVLQPLLDGKRLVILDLGPPGSSKLEFFSGFRCRLGIAGVAAALPELDEQTDAAGRQRLLKEMLPERSFGGTDLVLCWDLLNYLRPPAIGALMEHVHGLLREGAMVHALVAYSASALPEPPQPMDLRSDGWVDRSGQTSPDTRPAPRYSTGELQRLMPGFQVERAMLLKNGTQEYLFRR